MLGCVRADADVLIREVEVRFGQTVLVGQRRWLFHNY